MNTQGNNIFDDKPENLLEEEKTRPEVIDEGSVSGSASDPEEIEEKDTLDQAHDMGLYKDQDEEHPKELGLGEQINEAEGVIGGVDDEEKEDTEGAQSSS